MRQQVLCGASSSGSSPEIDTVGAADTTPAATSLGDAAGMGNDLNLFSGVELALDALGASTQWVVASAVGITLVTRADVGTLVYVVGSLLNAVFSKVLKKTINQVCVGSGCSSCCRDLNYASLRWAAVRCGATCSLFSSTACELPPRFVKKFNLRRR